MLVNLKSNSNWTTSFILFILSNFYWKITFSIYKTCNSKRGIAWGLISGLLIATVLGKDSNNVSDMTPLFIAALIFKIVWILSNDEIFALHNSTISQKKVKSNNFWVIKGYVLKWGIITLFKSSSFVTTYVTYSAVVYILPTKKKIRDFLYNIDIFFM